MVKRTSLPSGVRAGMHRQGVQHVGLVALLLAAVGVDPLVEVAVGVEQAHADQGHAHVGGRLQVVAGQDAQAARVDGQALVDAELGREIGHRRGVQRARP